MITAAPQALVFDFDGLILDTETPEFRAWQELFSRYGGTLTTADWAHVIGSLDSGWNPAVELGRQTGRTFDEAALRAEWKPRQVELLAEETIRPGVLELLKEARLRGIRLAVASSSKRWWVQGHLERLGIYESFDAVATGDEVPRTKPDPAVYLLALQRIDVLGNAAIALEDSPNGVRAAQAAGMRCVAVPNDVSRHLDLSAADGILDSLGEFDLESWI
ncbi:HAD family hydrolase [Actinospica sp. MGRD01-02]|uniref:HAD family hydrolase n=1 Tax=Actinospica acidithermotolerans TaxID=2828514 RepID=A0A941EAW2_9ACTN|nr:HAD family hydrolase [Actinospica acidithermotolerans]MBR7827103.1 HAD family hydrolase [Actinospica acidithermotolerans]